MKRIAIAFTCGLLLLLVMGCENDDEPPIPNVVVDYRTKYLGLYDIVSYYSSADWGPDTFIFTDSVKIKSGTDNQLMVPVEYYDYVNLRVNSVGTMTLLNNSNMSYEVQGNFVGVDGFFLRYSRTPIPHTWSYEVRGHRH